MPYYDYLTIYMGDHDSDFKDDPQPNHDFFDEIIKCAKRLARQKGLKMDYETLYGWRK